MKSNVVYYILLLLDSENSVRIPGLGVLTRHVQSAKILTKEWLVKPPRATVDFTASGAVKGKLLARYISYKSGVDPKVAADHVGEFTKAVKSSLRASGKASVDHLGVFYQKEENIYFAADVKTANAAYYGLKTVGLPGRADEPVQDADVAESVVVPIMAVNEVSQETTTELAPEPVTEQEPVALTAGLPVQTERSDTDGTQPVAEVGSKPESSKKKARVPMVLPIFLAIFLGVTVLAILQYNKRDALYHPAATYNRAPVQETPLFGSGKESKTESSDPTAELDPTASNKEEVDDKQTIAGVIDDSARDMLGLKNDNTASGDDDLEGDADSSDESKAQLGIDPKSGGASQMENAERPVDIVEENSEISDASEDTGVAAERIGEEEDITHSDVITSDPVESKSFDDEVHVEVLTSDCYVIVGAFGVQSNVDRMLARLTKMGYAPASMQRNNLTQIGVPAPCGSGEINRVLEDLQLNVEAEAWIYKK
ncbi:MAG: hypothetical protein DRI69_01580 [Bacteroidetes bacterium]|nr:MAG: hypothetical protein DRI69_01580 [Bacteroidota bacterium]